MTRSHSHPPSLDEAPLVGRKLWIPQMSWGGAVAFAAAFRSVGVDAEVCPDSDARSLELGSRCTSGEECLPVRVILGSFLKVLERPDCVPAQTALFMPTADGPCRFGQYAAYIRKVLGDLGLQDVRVFAPSSRDGYRDIGVHATELMRTALRGLVCADVLRKALHRTRPYEAAAGDADAVHARVISRIARVLERPDVPSERRMRELEDTLRSAREDFDKVPARNASPRLLIGVVGEIFCRVTPFTNDSIIRKIESLGGECTLAHIVEWVWYTNREYQNRLRRRGKALSKAMLLAKISDYVQHRDERRLYKPFADLFRGHEEPSVEEVLAYSDPYLPHCGALGEMTLSVGKAIFHYHQGCDGVADVAPFSCMNGIVTDAVYPRVSRDFDDIPIRNFFFDGTERDLERDLTIFMELARSYHARRATNGRLPAKGHRRSRSRGH